MAKKRKVQLTETDLAILNFVVRYRLGTYALVAKSILGDDSAGSIAKTSRIMRRLADRGFLRKIEWAPRQFYFVLTRKAAKSVNAPDRTPQPFSEQSLPAALAIAHHCLRNDVTRLPQREFCQMFPELWKQGSRSSSYYLDRNRKSPRLGLFVVDRGATTRRIESKLRRLISQRHALPAFRSLMQHGRFELSVLVGLPNQKENIKRRITEPLFGNVPVRVAMVPELGEILTGVRP